MAYRWLGVLLLGVACSVGCAGAEPGGPRGSGGSGGAGGVGGVGAGGGSGGVGGSEIPNCVTSVLCQSCPVDVLCDGDDDCAIGSVCIESGCDDVDGAPIMQCVFAGGGACTSSAMCPNGRECLDVPGEGKRCVKLTPGCDTSFDCVRGFTCENGTCVDRRVPCDLDQDCPKNHLCTSTSNSSFCLRIQIDCAAPFDCVDLAPACADVDGDGRTECAGNEDLNDPLSEACINDACGDGAAPVCEASDVGATTQCGQYGLCTDSADCAPSFECVQLWPDLRKECVPTGGSCSSFSDCPARQVCASPREGGPPSCQVGYQP